jgi:molybdate/tungstate transport system substrate-binding protein
LRRFPLALIVIVAVLVLSSALYLVQDIADTEVVLKVYCAGSLLFPLEAVVEAFETAYPHVDVHLEGHGSIQVIRHITELGDLGDVLMVADYSLIPLMMYNTTMPNTNQSFTEWCIRFAGNSIVLAYTNQSRYREDVTPDNWYAVIRRPDVRFGVSNPLIDALDYRGLMVAQLAEEYYSTTTLFTGLLNVHFTPPFT